MREIADASRVQSFMKELGLSVRQDARVYLTGGATAVLEGWRNTTLDIDIKLIPDSDEILRAIPRLKDQLKINIELASPDQFIPELPGWRDRSRFIQQVRRIFFFHYDFYSQVLAKLERGHAKDLLDVGHMLSGGFIEKDELLRLFETIEPNLYRYPALDPPSFRQAVERFLSSE